MNDLPSVGTEDALVISVDLQLITGFIFDPRPKSAIQRAAEIIEKLVSERDELASRVRELEAEVLDQCRLNGMGAERESALMGRVRELEAKPAQDAVDAEPTEAQIDAYCEAWGAAFEAENEFSTVVEPLSASLRRCIVAGLRAAISAKKGGQS